MITSVLPLLISLLIWVSDNLLPAILVLALCFVDTYSDIGDTLSDIKHLDVVIAGCRRLA